MILKGSHLHSKYFTNHLKQQLECYRLLMIYLIRIMMILFMLLRVGGRAMTRVRRAAVVLFWECLLKLYNLGASYSSQCSQNAKMENNHMAIRVLCNIYCNKTFVFDCLIPKFSLNFICFSFEEETLSQLSFHVVYEKLHSLSQGWHIGPKLDQSGYQIPPAKEEKKRHFLFKVIEKFNDKLAVRAFAIG